MKKQYTVLLLYPDYMSDGDETYHAWVQAESTKDAQVKAQQQAAEDNELEADKADNFLVLACYEGWRENIMVE